MDYQPSPISASFLSHTEQPIRVLVVEDDFLVCEEITRTIRKIGVLEQVGVASNGERAIEMAERLKPDVILMDIKMPKMDGVTAAGIIQDSNPTPIVILTAHESFDLVEEASRNGVSAYLTKPPKKEEIERAITIAMARHGDLMETRRLVATIKLRESELEIANQQLQELNASKDRFFSILAHDLRNPLSAMMGLSEMLGESVEDLTPDEIREDLLSIQKTANGAHVLMENLLLWARLQTGSIEYTPEVFNVSDLCQSVAELHRAGAQAKHIHIENHVTDTILVEGDRNMIHTVARNLVSNALKFTQRNGRIDLSVSLNEKEVVVCIQDTGIGIHEDKLDRLFRIDKNISTKGTAGESGTGLGLILCRDLIYKNRGRIWAKSALGEGTRFYFTIPIT
jgi:signal transduction histidine kinase